MLGFFPDPYPDESFYSICARYQVRARYNSFLATCLDIFDKNIRVAFDFPSGLGQLIYNMPPGHDYSSDQLINNNTLLPFYAPFLPPERVIKVREAMKKISNLTTSIHGAIGFLNSKNRLESLRFCPKCVDEDRSRFGETYWHRSHQISGLMVCFIHRVWLEKSSHLQNRQPNKFVSADKIVQLVKERFLDLRCRDHKTHLYIAENINWLLNHIIEPHSSSELQGRYSGLLIDRGFLSMGGRTRLRRLEKHFFEVYSKELLNELGCLFGRQQPNWLARMLQVNYNTHYPIKHLLLMNTLGVKAEEFFSLPVIPQPFGTGPWPCLNKICKYYNECVITSCELKVMKHDSVGLFGILQCECGFIYRLRKPPLKVNTKGSNVIVSFGSVWEAKLRELYNNGDNSICGIARQLGVSTGVIRRQAKRLDLIEQSSKDGIGANPKAINRWGNKIIASDELSSTISKHRYQWEKLVNENPAVSRTGLRKMQPALYTWLAKYDSQWLNVASPPPILFTGLTSSVDWKQRDIDLATAAQKYADNLRTLPGRPVRITKSRIAAEIGAYDNVEKRAFLIPLTINILGQVSETREEFAIRRIQWVADTIWYEGKRVNYSSLVKRACIPQFMTSEPEIQKKLREVLEELKNKTA